MSANAIRNYAYVSLLYGNNEYFFGALMLGYNLSSVKAIYDKVLLVTSDVPPTQRSLLSRFYKIIEIPYINTADQNFAEVNTIFRSIFTKLHIFNLTQYEKILFMDLDMLVLKNMDHLFEMEAPAAKFRRSGMTKGERCPDDFIKLIKNEETGFDEVSGGINAGMMLLEPNAIQYNQMILELKSPLPYKVHEPEQDYLSYRFRSEWRHIPREYNFQPLLENLYDPYQCPIQEIYNLHFSWYINPWELLFENREKVFSIINHLDPKEFVCDTLYFTLWEHQFRLLEHNLSLEKIKVFEVGKWTNMRSDFIEEYYKKTHAILQEKNLNLKPKK